MSALVVPCIAEALDRPVVAQVFVDAGIPRAGASRLELLAEEIGPEIAKKLRAFLEDGGRYPDWRDDELKSSIPDPTIRRAVLGEVKPRPLAFWAEPIHVPDDWSTIPCGYIRLSGGYSRPAAQAQDRGWPYRELGDGHFHLVVDLESVATELHGLLGSIGVSP